MPFEEQLFCQHLLDGGLTFAEMSQQLAMAELENRHKTPRLVISVNTQAVIYQCMPELLPGFAGYSTPVDWVTPATSLTLSDWLSGVSRFEAGICREELLKDTATMLRHMPITIETLLGNAALALQDMPASEGVKEILKFIKTQLTHCTLNSLPPDTLCSILYGLRHLKCSESTAILQVLLPHLIPPKVEIHFTAEHLKKILYSLTLMPACAETSTLYLALRPQIIAAMPALPPEVVGCVFYLLNYLPESINISACCTVLLVSLQPYLQGEERCLSPQVMVYIFNSLQRFPHSLEVDLVLDELKKHLDKNAQIGQWLTISELIKVLYGIQHLTLSKAVAGILSALQIYMANIKISQPILARSEYWLAETIYCFREYLAHSEQVVEDFLQTAAHVLGLTLPPLEQLRQPNKLIAQIYRLAPYLNKIDNVLHLDLRLCSLHLAIALCTYTLESRQKAIHYKQQTLSLKIIFPPESMSKSKSLYREQISQFLRNLLADQTCQWEAAHVTLPAVGVATNKRDASTLNDMVSSLKPQAALKRVKKEATEKRVLQREETE
jgi:hypothetical protein